MCSKSISQKILALFSGASLLLLVACSSEPPYDLVPPNDIVYSPVEYDTVTVKKGSFDNNIKLDCKPLNCKVETYLYRKSDYERNAGAYDIQFKELKVKLGDHVKKGDVLIEFSSKTFDKQIRDIKNRINELNNDLEHLQRLRQVDKEMDYDDQIAAEQNEIKYQKALLDEAENAVNVVNVVAKADGCVTKIGNEISNGIFLTDTLLLETSYNTGEYECKTDVSNIDQYIKTGQKYPAETYDGVKVEITCADAKSNESTGVTDISFVLDEKTASSVGNRFLMVSFNGIKLDNVLYVDSETIVINKDSKKMVYVKKEDGTLEARLIETYAKIDGSEIISSGVKEGDEVIVPIRK